MKRYEYKTLELVGGGMMKSLKLNADDIEKEMNKLGRQGWEFVREIQHLSGGSSIKIILIFRKEVG